MPCMFAMVLGLSFLNEKAFGPLGTVVTLTENPSRSGWLSNIVSVQFLELCGVCMHTA